MDKTIDYEKDDFILGCGNLFGVDLVLFWQHLWLESISAKLGYAN
jgi:hypothetical protein